LLISLFFSLKTKWVLDSGAIDYITRNNELLQNYVKWNTTQFVTVINGEKMKIIGSGSINLFSKEISNVLHVDKCSSNLSSINKITQELNYKIIFSSKSVIFQDWITKNFIGEGFSENGLYFFREQKLNLNAKKYEDMSNLWHKRIGHP
jgi:hypothetical protein